MDFKLKEIALTEHFHGFCFGRLAPDVPAETLNYVRERRKQMLAEGLSPPEKGDKEDADLDIQGLLSLCTSKWKMNQGHSPIVSDLTCP